MAKPGIIAIRIVRGDKTFHVHGIDQGKEGVWLAKGQVDGIYDSPVKSTWERGAFERGSRQKAVAWLHRDLQLGFHIIDTNTSFEWNESMFRQIFAFEADRWSETPIPTTIEIETEISGVRKLDVLLYEEPKFAADIDPIAQQYGNLILPLRSVGEPFWYEDDDITSFTSGATTAAGTILVSNPTDQPMYHTWVLTPAIWTLPDFQWVGDPGDREPGGTYGDRYLTDITITEVHGGASVTPLGSGELMWRDLNGTNILGDLGSTYILTHAIPPYTPEQYLPVSYKGAPVGGATAQLVQPRKWSKAYGLEGVTVVAPLQPDDMTTRLSYPGSYEYQIPAWCDRLDIVCVGGGGGGEGGGVLLTGAGGGAAAWAYTTVIRGVDIPWDTYTIKGVIGEGGVGGRGVDFDWTPGEFREDMGGGVDGANGTSTTATATGMTTIESVGGAGGVSGWVYGQGLADLTFNSKTYPGCGIEQLPGNRGNHPGGGGAGGWPLVGAGGRGGRGQVWIRAYGWAGS